MRSRWSNSSRSEPRTCKRPAQRRAWCAIAAAAPSCALPVIFHFLLRTEKRYRPNETSYRLTETSCEELAGTGLKLIPCFRPLTSPLARPQLLTVGKTLFCANTGDSMAVLYSSANNAVVELSRMHKPASPDEMARIHEAGGRVSTACAPTGRV